MGYKFVKGEKSDIYMWTEGVPVEEAAMRQLLDVAKMPFIHPRVVVLPDVHLGIGATVGSVIPTRGAIIPAAVGVDIGCGMEYVQTNLHRQDLESLDLVDLYDDIDEAVPNGRTDNGGDNDLGAWHGSLGPYAGYWTPEFQSTWEWLKGAHPKACMQKSPIAHLGTLGSGNHFIELTLDESDNVGVMLHSGSRGLGNRIGTYFIGKAREECDKWLIPLPHRDLAYLPDDHPLCRDYTKAVLFAQEFAAANRNHMMKAVLSVLQSYFPEKFQQHPAHLPVVSCHHNYIAKERHYGENVWVTRKGAIRAREGDMGIIPGSMGARSFIVRGKGSRESLHSCSHGAGRVMSRTEAQRTFSLEQHQEATQGVVCCKTAEALDETPGAYKSIDAVMAAQTDLVEVVHTLKQVLCVKGVKRDK